jgi:hypothetical protein
MVTLHYDAVRFPNSILCASSKHLAAGFCFLRVVRYVT